MNRSDAAAARFSPTMSSLRTMMAPWWFQRIWSTLSLTRAQSTSFLKAGWSRKWKRGKSCPASTHPTKTTRNATSSGRRRVDVLPAFEDRRFFSASLQFSDPAWTPWHHPLGSAPKAGGLESGADEHCSAGDCRMVADGQLPRAFFGKSLSTMESNPAAGRDCCPGRRHRSEEHTSELQSLRHLVCRLLLEKKKKHN